MTIFEKSVQTQNHIDPTYPLLIVIENTQITQGHTEYIIKVQSGWSSYCSSWQICKRYNDFVQLNNQYKVNNVKLDFPPKKYIGNLNQKFIAQRQIDLQKYLNNLSGDPILSLTFPFRKFLEEPNTVFSIQRFEDTGLQHISMVLRSESNFELDRVLPNIGWRTNKQYYLVRKKCNVIKNVDQYLLSWMQYGCDRTISDKDMNCVNKLLTSIQHENIEPIELFHSTDAGCVKIQKLNNEGSLRDIINSNCSFKDNYLKKYNINNKKLKLDRDKIIQYCIQILNILKSMHSKGFYYGHLHAGNILVSNDNNNIRLIDIENNLLGLSPMNRPSIIQHKKLCCLQNIDIYNFGLLLYEMCTGQILHNCICDHIPEYIDIDIRTILESILSTKCLNTNLPTIDSLLQSTVFITSTSSSLNNSNGFKINTNMKDKLVILCKTIEDRLNHDYKQLKNEKRLQRLEKILDCEDTKYYVQQKRAPKKFNNDESCDNSVPKSSFDTSDSPSSSTRSSDGMTPPPSSHILSPNLPSQPPPLPSLGPVETAADTSRSALLSAIQSFNKDNLKNKNKTLL